MRVVAGVLRDAGGRILVTRRGAGRHLAGRWEFPGGKVVPGESRVAALVRELDEELGIRIERARPLITIPHAYPSGKIVLDVWEVHSFQGRARAREEQELAWLTLDEIDRLPMPDADLPARTALRLPSRYVITPPAATRDEVIDGVERALAAGERLFQLRLPVMPREVLAGLAREVVARCRPHAARALVNADWRLAMQADCDGVHLPARLAATLDARPVPAGRWLGVSCHDAAELAHARRIGADFATLSPLAATPSHADATPLGWTGFRELANASPLPVYALGGVGPADIACAHAHGAQGIAAIRGLWPQ
jgi:8-oxo-dGTP diphosphatase